MKQSVKLSILLLTGLLFLTGCGKEQVPEKTGQTVKVPAFTTKDLNGNTVTEEIFTEKDLTVVNIWGTFCPPCIEEMPALGEWAREMPDNVQIIGIVCDIEGEDDTEHKELALEILEKAEAEYTQLIPCEELQNILGKVIGVPTTFFVDKEGNMVGKWIVGADVSGYQKYVEEYFSEQ